MRNATSARRFDSPTQETYLSLWRTYDRLRALEDELFAKFDLVPQQYNLLRLLRTMYPEPVPTLSMVKQLVSRAPNVTRMLDHLEERGLIERNRCKEDRRNMLVCITGKGIALLKEISEPLKACHEHQLGHLSVAELKQLNTLLMKVRSPHEPKDSPWK